MLMLHATCVGVCLFCCFVFASVLVGCLGVWFGGVWVCCDVGVLMYFASIMMLMRVFSVCGWFTTVLWICLLLCVLRLACMSGLVALFVVCFDGLAVWDAL